MAKLRACMRYDVATSVTPEFNLEGMDGLLSHLSELDQKVMVFEALKHWSPMNIFGDV